MPQMWLFQSLRSLYPTRHYICWPKSDLSREQPRTKRCQWLPAFAPQSAYPNPLPPGLSPESAKVRPRRSFKREEDEDVNTGTGGNSVDMDVDNDSS
jgi:hypothetical protein